MHLIHFTEEVLFLQQLLLFSVKYLHDDIAIIAHIYEATAGMTEPMAIIRRYK